ncbi:MAG: hypothetical protein KF785_10860, partial [Gemmatimonadales bacterium]|nr:hypothetical protein [Gemmatimonadales bacterium]
NININLYSERPALPTYIEYSVDGKKLGEEDQSKRVSRDGIIREVEVGAVLSPRAARAIIVWLGIQLDKLESHKEKGADEA